MDYITSLPFGLAVSALFAIVMLRANATYWAGRGIAAGGRRTRLERQMDSPAMRRAEAIIARWGAPAVSLCFLTVGIQTAVNATAGIGRMPLRQYLPAVIIGSVLWAVLYATVGLGVLNAWLAAVAGSPAGIILMVVLTLAIGVVVLRRHRSRIDAGDSHMDDAGSQVDDGCQVGDGGQMDDASDRMGSTIGVADPASSANADHELAGGDVLRRSPGRRTT